MFTLWERLVAWTWGLPEYAQFFLWVALICLLLATAGQLSKEIGRLLDHRRAQRLARRILQDYSRQDGGCATWDDSMGREYDEPVYTSCPREDGLEDFVWDGKGCRQCGSFQNGCSQIYPIMSAHDRMIHDRLHGD